VRTDSQEIALLRILVATAEKALEAFEATDNPVDRELVADLRRVIERSRGELDTLIAAQSASP
jgi:hypothetical protein